ncbi:hypothetical protein [Candidatus Nitrosocosmicus hydrocola]|jgi:hypothetical protein|uniref:hypothetical protein n=1 Tax=Candidatus Nitrosocosmicus hydrocola TaxID=1826872 RepID=UPI0011E5B8F1|nr:hypothetical protein [Candidatus Nitrosocosmicus hydrocola]
MNKLNHSKSEFTCLDSYEAEKLSSIFSKQKDDKLFVKEIVKIVESEVVVRLNDGSHHSILFKDKTNALKLSFFFKNLIQNNGIISETGYCDDKAFIFWNQPLD